MNDVNKTVAVVTGASRGIGFEVAMLLAKKNVHVIALARTVGGLEALSDKITGINGSSTMVPINLTNFEELNKLALNIFERWKKIDVFIHCASASTAMSPVTSLPIKDFEKLFMINTSATLNLIQVFDPLLRASNIKKAVFIDDNNRGKFLSAYASSKAAAREIIKIYKEESKRIGAKVIIFNPNPMPTNLRAKFYPGEDRTKLSSCVSQARKLVKLIKL